LNDSAFSAIPAISIEETNAKSASDIMIGGKEGEGGGLEWKWRWRGMLRFGQIHSSSPKARTTVFASRSSAE